MIVEVFYRLHFDGPIAWERVAVYASGVVERDLRLTDAARERLRMIPRRCPPASCGDVVELNRRGQIVCSSCKKPVEPPLPGGAE